MKHERTDLLVMRSGIISESYSVRHHVSHHDFIYDGILASFLSDRLTTLKHSVSVIVIIRHCLRAGFSTIRAASPFLLSEFSEDSTFIIHATCSSDCGGLTVASSLTKLSELNRNDCQTVQFEICTVLSSM